MTTKDLKDHLKTTHSQLEVFRPCYYQHYVPGLQTVLSLKINFAVTEQLSLSVVSKLTESKQNETFPNMFHTYSGHILCSE